jgi:hypothetical protein
MLIILTFLQCLKIHFCSLKQKLLLEIDFSGVIHCRPVSSTTIGLYHPLDSVTNPRYKLLHVLITNFFCKDKKFELRKVLPSNTLPLKACCSVDACFSHQIIMNTFQFCGCHQRMDCRQFHIF